MATKELVKESDKEPKEKASFGAADEFTSHIMGFEKQFAQLLKQKPLVVFGIAVGLGVIAGAWVKSQAETGGSHSRRAH